MTAVTYYTTFVPFVKWRHRVSVTEEVILQHLDGIRANVKIDAPEAEVGQLDIYGVS
jgi:hypothetical protein